MDQDNGMVISGAGLAISLGVGREAAWRALRDGQIGLGPLTQIEDPAQAERGGGEVPRAAGVWPGSDPDEPREPALLRYAINEALQHAGLDPRDPAGWPVAPHRCGIMLGTTLHGMTAGGRMVRSGSAEPLQDFLAPAVIARATSHLPLEGFAATTCSACSSGLGSLLLAATLLRSGQLDLVIAGGYDPISEYAYAGFNSLRLVDERMPRPFARDRAGMKVSEGYGILIVERAEALAKRGWEAFLWLRGGGESADAHHLTQPMQDGSGASRAIRGAVAGLNDPGEIDLVVAHATGTPDNDAAEVAALSGVLGDRMADTPVVGLKSRLGHTLGAAGAAELIFAGLALRDQVLPTTATTTADQVDFTPFCLSEGEAKPAELRTSLNTSLGFGGANTAVVVSRPSEMPAAAGASGRSDREVWITGLGVVLPGFAGADGFDGWLSAGEGEIAGPVAEDDYLSLLNARRVRRLSDYVKLTLASATLAMNDAGLEAGSEAAESFGQDAAGLLGTAHGSTHYSYDYYRGIVDDGLLTANPMLFAEGVPNAGAAHLSMSLKLRGACQSIIGSWTSGLDALRLASLRIADGSLERAVVCAGEEHDELVERCYAELGLPLSTVAASVTLVLESRASAEARGVGGRGVVESGSSRHFGRRVQRGVACVADLLEAEAGAGVERIVGPGSATWLGRIVGGGSRRSGVKVCSRSTRLAEGFSSGPMLSVARQLTAESGRAGDRGSVLAGDLNGMVSMARIRRGSR